MPSNITYVKHLKCETSGPTLLFLHVENSEKAVNICKGSLGCLF